MKDELDRPLPAGYTVLEAVGSDRNVVEIPEDAFRDFVGDVRLRGFVSPECEDRGGCFRLVAGEEYCMLPCTLPEVTPPSPPQPPEAPRFEACPAGWTSELGACTPPPEVACAVGEAQLLGESACTSVAGPCLGRFPSGLSGTIAYVDAGTAGVGSGSEADPYQRLSSALASGAETVAVAAGSYTESLVIDRSVEIAGACRDVILQGALTITGDAVTIRNVRLTGSNVPLTIDGSLTLDDAELAGQQYGALVRSGGTLTAHRLLVQMGSRGLLEQGGTLSLTSARILGGVGPGVAGTAGVVELTDVYVSGRTTSATTRGAAVQIGAGAALTGTRVYTADTEGEGLSVSGAGAQANLTDLVIRDEPGRWLPKHGVEALNGASVTLERALITDTGYIGISVDTASAQVTDVVLSDTGRAAMRVQGTASTLTAERVHATRPRYVGVRGQRCTLRLIDASIEDVQPGRISIEGETQGAGGRGIDASTPDRVALTRVEVMHAISYGVSINSAVAADLNDVRVQDVTAAVNNATGILVYNTPGTINKTFIGGVPGIGLDLFASTRTPVKANDVSIADVKGAGIALSQVGLDAFRIEVDGAGVDGALRFDWSVVNVNDGRFVNLAGIGAQVGTRDNMDYRESFFRLDRGRFDTDPDGPCLALGWYGTIEANDLTVANCRVGFDIVVVEVGRERVPEGIRFSRNGENVRTAGGE